MSLGFFHYDGSIQLLNQPLDRARKKIAYIPQRSQVNWNFPITVKEIVLMGNSKRRFGWQGYSRQEQDRAWTAMEKMQLLPLMDRQISQLSGAKSNGSSSPAPLLKRWMPIF